MEPKRPTLLGKKLKVLGLQAIWPVVPSVIVAVWTYFTAVEEQRWAQVYASFVGTMTVAMLLLGWWLRVDKSVNDSTGMAGLRAGIGAVQDDVGKLDENVRSMLEIVFRERGEREPEARHPTDAAPTGPIIDSQHRTINSLEEVPMASRTYFETAQNLLPQRELFAAMSMASVGFETAVRQAATGLRLTPENRGLLEMLRALRPFMTQGEYEEADALRRVRNSLAHPSLSPIETTLTPELVVEAFARGASLMENLYEREKARVVG
ncbi:hypothetical protein [Brevundimonas sp.]|uniref:hypothetical protein n=1 Tax=Brevundimonas sp. TaxID=1871086 RepID=UPI0035B07F29